MPERVTIISTCEFRSPERDPNSKNYEPMSKRLVYSVRKNGGRYSNSPILMYHARGTAPSRDTRSWLKDNGCTVIEGPEDLISGEPVGNKIQACCMPFSTEFGLFMDSDMYVLDTRLFEILMEKDVDVAATGSEYSHHRWGRLEDAHLWSKLYEIAEVEPPNTGFVSGLDSKPVHFYFNSAIVLFRNGRNFPDIWKEMALKVRFSGVPNADQNYTQTSLTLAALKTKSTFEQLPQTYNAYYALEKEKALEKAILHYQDNVVDFDPRIKWNV